MGNCRFTMFLNTERQISYTRANVILCTIYTLTCKVFQNQKIKSKETKYLGNYYK